MKIRSITIWLAVVLLVVTGSTRADFTLYDSEQLTVNTYHNNGWLYDSSRVDIVSGGDVYRLEASDSSTANVSGGSVSYLEEYVYGSAYISGGDVDYLYAYDSSTVIFDGKNFDYGSGLTLDGNRVLGTGTLSGEWLNGALWSVDIMVNQPTATILAIPEPATLLLLGLGAVILRKHKK